MSVPVDGSADGAAARGERPRLRVGVVSAGRVGSVLGAALQRAGHHVVAVAGVSAASLTRAEELLPGVPVLPPDEVVRQADLVVLAVPDDALGGMVRGLVATESLRAGQIVVHTSGAHGVDVLDPAAEAGALPIALHPAMTFTGRSEDVERLATACVAITAGEQDEAGFHVAEALTLELGAEPVRVPEQSRKLYHAALTHGANHLVTLVNECAQLLRDAGVATPERVMAPLLSASLDNSLRHGDRAATGPVARGDSGTVRAHLDVLDAADPAVVPAYVELAKRTAERAVRSGVLRSGDATEVRDVLDGEQ
ncbi:putative short-subunit dehydrogenase-like oxidoreductase (DUF2520 family) [Saccharopolyspora lacisalsi]|uniref:Putative short-subunit dehydrogenase-like oxidoreductase (DUF2520 family) n=1 Tax=Halosaccharopolyspora lacisalsi TaxID=1000566 RepID=A0A839E5G7_9PSEU|nr:DUF2520 domain-containing protein [Halosaccharopolyspora lacisalsi]MBA8826571.1 putative short-subunit dehydrogenase-like oxidoreductase (DUF2520 family) [Halosaccharopolyspora lacisalsi]